MLYGLQIYGTRRIYGFIDGYIDAIARGIHAAAHDRNASLLLACGLQMLTDIADPRPAWPWLSPRTDFLPVGPWNTDGLVVVHPLRSEERAREIRKLKQSGFPIVYVGTAEGGPAIGMDNDVGMRQAVAHLVAHGHRRIAFIAGYDNDMRGDSGQRVNAFKAAVHEYGLDLDPRLIAFGNHRIAEGRMAMQKIIESGAPFSAVIASNDSSAFGAMQLLNETGRRIPQDVAMIGFDDRPEGTFSLPPLTTVHQPIFERGYQAGSLLLDALEGGRALEDEIINIPTRLVLRRSCGCAAEDVVSVLDAEHPPSTFAASLLPLRARLARTMADAIVPDTQRLNVGEILQMLRRMIDAFIESLKCARRETFSGALQALLLRVEKIGGNMSAWTRAVEAMESAPELESLVRSLGTGHDYAAHARQMLEHARNVIDRSARRLKWREQYFVFEENELLAARLLVSARSEADILTIMAEYLPSVGIPRSAVVLFEAEGDDPVAWSRMLTTDDPRGEPIRFRTREFPPFPFTPAPDASTRLVLVPLKVDEDVSGYAVFETNSLELCASLAHAINAALRSSREHRAAREGRRAAEEASRIKSQFLSMVSHELRTPVSVILAAAELLASRKACHSEDDAHAIERVEASAQHLDGLIRDVLDLAVDHQGRLQLACEALDVASALRPVIVVGEQLTSAKGLEWRVHIQDDLPRVWGDRARLRQIVLNLISNAVKFTPSGSVTLRVFGDATSLRICVEDTGVGVPPADHQAIFEDFQKSRQQAPQTSIGMGLGLAIARRLTSLHAGTISVESSGVGGEGSRFWVALPALAVSPEQIESVLPRGNLVCLIGGEMGSTESLASYLMQKGYDIAQFDAEDPFAADGVGVINPGHVFLVDAAVAQKGGWTLIKRLREAGATDVRLFCLADEQVAGESSRAEYLSKPIGTAELAASLAQASEAPDDGKRTILIAEDDAGLLEMHAKIVQNCLPSYRVLKAVNGDETLQLALAENPDLILMDLVMPGMDGFEVLERLRSVETRRHVPAVVLTARPLTEEETLRLGKLASAILAKGVFTVQETLDLVQRILTPERVAKGEGTYLAHRAMAYIHEHFSQPLTRRDIAARLNVTEDHLTRYFKIAVNMPPMTYLTRYRINRAKELLVSGGGSVGDIGKAVGFSSEFHFSYVFKRITGLSPTAYRRSHSM